MASVFRVAEAECRRKHLDSATECFPFCKFQTSQMEWNDLQVHSHTLQG